MMRLLLVIAFSACASADKQETTAEDRAILVEEHRAFSGRLLDQHNENGWVVSREAGQPRHMGDSLLWTGITMAALSCEDGQIFSDRMRTMLKENAGALVRYEPLPETYKDGREVSFDGATGLYFGILSRLMRCDSDIGDWDAIWRVHLDYLERNYGYLHPNTTVAVEPPFGVLRDLITATLGQGEPPGGARIAALESAATAWAYAVKKVKEPCFRIHLAWLHMAALEWVGELSQSGRNAFCSATTGTEMPLIDIWCGRMAVTDWDFQLNAYEYASQRCAAWEVPDGKGYDTPALDYIYALREVTDER